MSDFDRDALLRSRLLDVLESDDATYEADDLGGYDELEAAAVSAHPTSSIEGKLSLRDQKWQSLDSVAKFARINPPSVLQGIIGNQASVHFGEAKEVANWGGEDSETLPVTVTFGLVQVQPSSLESLFVSGDPYRPYGIVRFGTRGFLLQIEVDINQGCQFTISGSQVVLQVALPENSLSASLTPDFKQQNPLQLSGMLSFYPCVRAVPITRTLYTSAASGGGTSDTLIIPLFARSLVLWRDQPASSVTITFLGRMGAPIYTAAVAGGAEMATPVPVPANAAFVRVTSGGGAGTINYQLIFQLSL